MGTEFNPGDKVLVAPYGQEATVERRMPDADDYEVTFTSVGEDDVATRYVGAGALTLIKAAKASSKASASTAEDAPTA